MFHAPGQLSVYPIVPLQWHGFTIGEYLRRLESAVRRTLRQLGVEVEQGSAFAGRTGSLAALGVTVRDWVAYNGAFISVSPPVALLRFFDRWSPERNRVSSLVAERQGPVRMATVRAEVVRQVAQALGCDRYHLHTGHPLLRTGE
ncbi:MAG: hypothetical protein GXY83_06855 [Rhodopirellula sp.]|nr:hypothetical protein [Rhodopirellula sp.]